MHLFFKCTTVLAASYYLKLCKWTLRAQRLWGCLFTPNGDSWGDWDVSDSGRFRKCWEDCVSWEYVSVPLENLVCPEVARATLTQISMKMEQADRKCIVCENDVKRLLLCLCCAQRIRCEWRPLEFSASIFLLCEFLKLASSLTRAGKWFSKSLKERRARVERIKLKWFSSRRVTVLETPARWG